MNDFRPKPHHRLLQLGAEELEAEYESASGAYQAAMQNEDRFNAIAILQYSVRVSDLLRKLTRFA